MAKRVLHRVITLFCYEWRTSKARGCGCVGMIPWMDGWFDGGREREYYDFFVYLAWLGWVLFTYVVFFCSVPPVCLDDWMDFCLSI